MGYLRVAEINIAKQFTSPFRLLGYFGRKFGSRTTEIRVSSRQRPPKTHKLPRHTSSTARCRNSDVRPPPKPGIFRTVLYRPQITFQIVTSDHIGRSDS
ncbi:hypothetical protein J6590_016208 [Homalodisca vitripennis]|nr:hypothetical protein J6590_016208 [Homalodisca vitripennis]